LNLIPYGSAHPERRGDVTAKRWRGAPILRLVKHSPERETVPHLAADRAAVPRPQGEQWLVLRHPESEKGHPGPISQRQLRRLEQTMVRPSSISKVILGEDFSQAIQLEYLFPYGCAAAPFCPLCMEKSIHEYERLGRSRRNMLGVNSPWYPTMRLFRQKKPADWTGVFEEIEAELRTRVRSVS
jgi:hypothetical protein